MSYATIAPAAASTSPVSSLPAIAKSVPESPFEIRLKAALEHARRLSEMHGSRSIDAALAWETVEELETAKTRRTNSRLAFARYCAENPHALEARMYDV